MATVQRYTDLIAWQRSMSLAKQVYELTSRFPREEMFGLTSQIRRAVVSIASNIAEGQGRGSSKDFVRHLRIAQGSRQELETQVRLALEFGYIQASDLDETLSACDEVARLVYGLIRAIRQRDPTGF